ncbi:ATP-dependent protease La [Enhygromyxa salina]|uniref:Lon protease n=1 Tax=Enhygromyxa salina TaxID=215803 RepID=A0A0C1ZM12_9BACT|nr:S16 family serine protease [Enhygromyxa salina]KIG11908.1 ATP-dependent protease La [Enhygromyxa salina]
MSNGPLAAGVLPLLPLRSAVLFPGVSMPIDLARPASVEAVRRATHHGHRDELHNLVIVAVQRDPMNDQPGFEDLHPIATATRIVQVLRGLPGRMTVIVRGLERVRLDGLERVEGCDLVRYQRAAVSPGGSAMLTALAGVLRDLVKRHESLLPASRASQQRQESVQEALDERDAARVGDLVANLVEFETLDRVALLQQLDGGERLRKLVELLAQRCNELEVKRDIDRSVREHLSRHEQEAVLRHKLRAIQAELGDDDPDSWLDELAERLDQKILPEQAQLAVDRELARLERMNPQSSEAVISRTYCEWFADLPWLIPERRVDDPGLDVNLEDARARLEADHHGLDKVKKRVLEYLAVRRLAPNQRGPLLCFAGPPGVGKTTLAQSIAATLGREFVRFSLGGVRDDAEIRGHRRTYVGALPGRLIQAMKKAGTHNPVILLDELDKLSGADLRGDPASALLEALDPEQNDAFEDHYLNVPYDFSQVIFICTANEVGAIPAVLRDRLEFIYLSGYTLEEKLQIARKHLLPKELRDNGLLPALVDASPAAPGSLRDQRARNTSLLVAMRREGDDPVPGAIEPGVEISDAVLELLATEYTRESGVRNLQRRLAALLRDVAMQKAEADLESFSKPAVLEVEDVGRILGPPRYREELMASGPRVGVCTGLGWTPTGGRLLFVEVTIVAGTGKLRLTGRLGDVMKESAQAALSLIRSQAERLGVGHVAFDKRDVHVHLPSGAVPKDGPSAGIALTTALLSALGGRSVRHDIAMTGEVTLRGHVLAIGGVREKVLAAHRAGITDVILPARNRKDEPDIPAAALADLRLHFVSHVDEVLALALCEVPARASA